MLSSLLLALAVAIEAQPATVSVPIDPGQVRAMALEAVASAHGDGSAALTDLDARVKARWGDVLTDAVSISDAPTEIRLFSPYAAYRKSIAELLKRGQPIEPLTFRPLATVIVVPARVDAPDVTAIVVRRGGTDVAPVANALSVRPITSPMGITRNLHAGFVAFPAGAFAPGAEVTAIAVVEGGSPLTLTLDAATLSRFR